MVCMQENFPCVVFLLWKNEKSSKIFRNRIPLVHRYRLLMGGHQTLSTLRSFVVHRQGITFGRAFKNRVARHACGGVSNRERLMYLVHVQSFQCCNVAINAVPLKCRPSQMETFPFSSSTSSTSKLQQGATEASVVAAVMRQERRYLSADNQSSSNLEPPTFALSRRDLPHHAQKPGRFSKVRCFYTGVSPCRRCVSQSTAGKRVDTCFTGSTRNLSSSPKA